MAWPFVCLILLSVATCTYLVLRLWRSMNSLSRGMPDFHPVVEITRERDQCLLSLALVNKSLKDIWVEECVVIFTEFDGIPSKGFEATCKGVLRIREFVNARETIRVGLCPTVYDAAGRPQGLYRFIICGTVKYSIEKVEYAMLLPPRLVKMNCLVAIEVRKPPKRAAPRLRRSFDQASLTADVHNENEVTNHRDNNSGEGGVQRDTPQ